MFITKLDHYPMLEMQLVMSCSFFCSVKVRVRVRVRVFRKESIMATGKDHMDMDMTL